MASRDIMKCHYCGKGPEKDEMRPYGPNGAWIHFDCMMADPKRTESAKQEFGKQLDAAGPVAVIDGDPTGVRPYKPSEN